MSGVVFAPDPTFTASKLIWLRERYPDAMTKARHWLHVSDWLAFRLSGCMATDLSLASRTMLLDLRQRVWSDDLMAASGVDPMLLPEIRPIGSPLGPLLPEFVRDLGISASCMVGVGGHDHICGMLAIGADRPGHLLDSMGTAEGLTMSVPAPVFNQSVEAAGLNQGAILVQGCDPIWYVFGGLPTSAAAIDWFCRHLAAGETIQDLIEQAARQIPAVDGPLFFPQLRLGSPPYPDSVARGGFVGVSPTTDKATMFTAVLEGVALDGAQILDCMLHELHVDQPKRITAIGGSTQNRLLMAMKAATMERSIAVTETHDATALGAAMLAGLATGLYTDLEEARARFNLATTTIDPLSGWHADVIQRRKQAYALGKSTIRQIHATLLGKQAFSVSRSSP